MRSSVQWTDSISNESSKRFPVCARLIYACGLGPGAAPPKEEVKVEKKKGGDLKVIELEGGELPPATSTIEGNVKVTHSSPSPSPFPSA